MASLQIVLSSGNVGAEFVGESKISIHPCGALLVQDLRGDLQVVYAPGEWKRIERVEEPERSAMITPVTGAGV